MQNVSSKFPGVGHTASPEILGLGDPGAMTRVRGAGRGAQILLGGAGRRAPLPTLVPPGAASQPTPAPLPRLTRTIEATQHQP
jgi:hypothetical protein